MSNTTDLEHSLDLLKDRLKSHSLYVVNDLLGLIRFRGHLPKGGYDVLNGRLREPTIPVGGSRMISKSKRFYNQRRRHSTLGQISPAAFERTTAA